MFLKPKEGLKIFDPKTKRELPASGKHVTASEYWQRCIDRGDVLLVTQISDFTTSQAEG